jgi:exosortase A-associated hydrolase 2
MPFAEELNKSRRMAALQARAMAAAGYTVLQIDLLGCGDSSGDFGDATWEAWLADVELACDWLQQQTATPLWLWGQRTGCLLANEAANRMQRPVNLLFWQPVVSGKQFLQQFLRLKLAAEILGGESKGVMERLRKQLQQGESVEVAGYLLSPALAAGLEKAELLLAAPLWPRRVDRNLQPAGCQPVARRPGAADAVAGGRPARPRQPGQRSGVLADERGQRVSGTA